MKRVRLKFKCDETGERVHWDKEKGKLFSASLSPVMDGSEENKSFFAATPTGEFKVGSVVPNVFEVGKEYYLEVIPADSVNEIPKGPTGT